MGKYTLMDRYIVQNLKKWKEKKSRLPLILLGARQIGKTYILEEFGKRFFANYHCLNFEETKTLKKVFEKDLNPHRILEEIEAITKKQIDIEEDLVIFDEIQNCPEALTSMKYFAEKIPKLCLIAAGSLLGVELSNSSFPVGKVDILKMFPMTFNEFLMGIGETKVLKYIENFKSKKYIPDAIHEELWRLLKIYLIVGGLPAVINTYKEETSFEAVRQKQKILIDSYNADIAKHSGKINAMQINRIWSYIPTLLDQEHLDSSPQFKFKDILPGKDNRYSKFAGAIDWLETAGLVIRTPIVEHIAKPLKSKIRENKFKLFIFDIGILGALAGVDPGDVLAYDYGSYKGLFMENFVAEELVAAEQDYDNLFSWKENSAELEFVKEIDGVITGIEVKAGHITKSKSLSSFLNRYDFARGVIASANNYANNNNSKAEKLPLYLMSQIVKD